MKALDLDPLGEFEVLKLGDRPAFQMKHGIPC
jgi:hypothetical protein